ncbi:valine--tRNA ligase [Mesonia sp. HuA40]|uniref:valine--tRNA ligase n=1 Tax=Mesonia sp. HuA40 TaxID=2602761 RepID=UPI0011CA3AB6|nr:valine--tRNA ligase [Mesonia sp. HuA40]TXK73824.1 valine--tRNA ligase [Mesonia sp. HuA40]
MPIAANYNPKEIEEKWYKYWLENRYFHSEVNEKEPYTIVIPPPNVTGVLHMGHMLNNTIQDVLVRRARLQGYNACWVPGTDHASIATEAKVVAKLKEEGIDKKSLSREEFMEHAWDWTRNYGGVILNQLQKLGASCDWDRTKFTLDEQLSASVIKSFIDLYKKGHIYRGYRMVNWDPEAKTTLSDEEVIYEEKQGHLYHVAYPIVGSDEHLIIATTRPETIFGDTAICVHPDDERYQHLHGKNVIVPVVNREIPIIADEYVDLEFGTGCLKITPAHDENDYLLGQKHNLEMIDIFNLDGSLNKQGLHYQGQDRFEVRKQFRKELEEKGFLVKIEDHIHKVGTSERTKAVIEPRLSDQWFLKMKEIAQPAIKAVLETEEIKLFPEKFKNTYAHWMNNIRDWNISRQLWWGHRIPAYYFGDNKNDFVVAETKEEALKLAQEKSGQKDLKIEDLKQDEDVLDTWFSSWLWPMSVFDGICQPDNKEFNYYYPTNDLVTGPDILFFWVARMIIAGYEYTGKKPFNNVYLTGLVRDKQRRKMSKSLGNSPDALKLIEDYSADGVRVGLLLSSAAGNDLMFDESLCQQGKGFGNKIWNAFRLIDGWEVDTHLEQPEYAQKAIQWYKNQLQVSLAQIEDHFDKYRISDALMTTYKLIWDEFCSWLLEMVKPGYQMPIDQQTKQDVLHLLEENLKILHPFMPFLTEEIWQSMAKRSKDEALIVAKWPEQKTFDESLIADFDTVKEVVSGIRNIRKDKNISFKETVDLSLINSEQLTKAYDGIIKKLGNINQLSYIERQLDNALSFRVKSNEYFIPMQGTIDVEAEIAKLQDELKYNEGFLKAVQKKLSNERFVNNAPEKVVAIEKQKQADAMAKIETLKQSLESLKK